MSRSGELEPRRADRAFARRAARRAPCLGAGKGLICPAAQGAEAAWAGDVEVVAAPDLLALLAHLKGTQLLPPPAAGRGRAAVRRTRPRPGQGPGDRQARARDRRGRRPQSADERAAGRGQVAARRLPAGHPAAADPSEALEVSMVASRSPANWTAGACAAAGRSAPRTTAPRCRRWSAAGSRSGRARSAWRISASCSSTNCPSSSARVLDSLRQPLETGTVSVARANTHVTFPARVQLVAAMNPCRCGHLGDPALACSRAPRCAADYQAQGVGPAARPDRPPRRSAGRQRRRPDACRRRPKAAPRWRRASPRRASVQSRRYNGQRRPHQCRGGRRIARQRRHARRAGPQAARRRGRGDAPVGARLSPGAAGRADDRRPGGRRDGRPVHIAEALSYRRQAPRN